MKKASKNRNVIAVNNSSDTMSNEVQPSYEHTFLQIGTMQQRWNKSIYASCKLSAMTKYRCMHT